MNRFVSIVCLFILGSSFSLAQSDSVDVTFFYKPSIPSL